MELCSVYVPTNHLYIGDIFLVNSEEIIRPNLSIREGIGMLSLFLTFAVHCDFVLMFIAVPSLSCILQNKRLCSFLFCTLEDVTNSG